MSKFLIVLVAFALIQTSLALKCRKCGNTECSMDKLVEEQCPAPPSTSKVGCLTEINKEEATGKEIITRKCVNFPQTLNKYGCVTTPGTKNIECNTCFEDLCNSAKSITSFGVFVTILALILPRFM